MTRTLAGGRAVDGLSVDGLSVDGLSVDGLSVDGPAGHEGVEPDGHRRQLDELSRMPVDGSGRSALRDEVVETHLPLVRFLALRYRNLGEPLDDLIQVGTIGLIHAVDRFDPHRGTAFATYAAPTILGEIKRHFRDRAWSVRMPRRLQELRQRLSTSSAELSQELGRAPTIGELARRAGTDEESAIEALEAQRTCTPVPIEFPVAELTDAITEVDTALEDVVDREALRPLLQQLPAREKRILVLRFFRGLSQAEIADEIGISQMHVSRLLARTVDQLRSGLTDHREEAAETDQPDTDTQPIRLVRRTAGSPGRPTRHR
jgi:RNA polymerase sigma-B factor